jgi:hypothetical protein
MRTKIYKTREEFLTRTIRDENGVSEAFAKAHPNYESINFNNRGCWDCLGCTNCVTSSNCVDCFGCKNCSLCNKCYNCSDCQDCEDCYNCINCDGCNNCNNCIDCADSTNCYDCNNCDACMDCITCLACDNCSNCSFCNNCDQCSDCNYTNQGYHRKSISLRQMEHSLLCYEDSKVITGLNKLGFQSFEQLAETTGESAQLLRNWCTFHPKRFSLLLAGAHEQVSSESEAIANS